MLSRASRLKTKKDIERVLARGKFFKEDFLILKIIENTLPGNRFGLIVSKKVSKKAVIRNKIKRRLRAIIAKKNKKLKKGADILLIACPGQEAKNFLETDETINKIFTKAKLFNAYELDS